jgi:hypothetical protein
MCVAWGRLLSEMTAKNWWEVCQIFGAYSSYLPDGIVNLSTPMICEKTGATDKRT